MAAHIRRYLQEVRPKLKGKRDPGNLLLGREGKPLTRLTMKRMRTLLKGAGLSEGRLNELSPVHCLRHSCGVMLYRATKNLRRVQKQLRHSRSTTTEVHANLLDEDWRAGWRRHGQLHRHAPGAEAREVPWLKGAARHRYSPRWNPPHARSRVLSAFFRAYFALYKRPRTVGRDRSR